MENNENKDWKPEVGKTAWLKTNHDIKLVKINEHFELSNQFEVQDRTSFWIETSRRLFPTPEAALASIKIYDLEGKEVVIPRAQDKIIIEMCDRAAEQIANLSEWDDADYAQLGMAPIINAFKEIIAVRDRAAIKMVAKLVYEMNLPENPEGEARLKAAQERFKSAIGGKSDQREGGC